jgi:hypothetical protein
VVREWCRRLAVAPTDLLSATGVEYRVRFSIDSIFVSMFTGLILASFCMAIPQRPPRRLPAEWRLCASVRPTEAFVRTRNSPEGSLSDAPLCRLLRPSWSNEH